LASNRSKYAPFVNGEEGFDSYLRRMREGEWGDHLTLQAFADTFGHPVHIVTSYESRGFIQIQPQVGTATPVQQEQRARSGGGGGGGAKEPLLIGFWSEVHYNPVVYADSP